MLAAILALPKDSISDSGAEEFLDCVLQFHDVFDLENRERGEVKGIEHAIDTVNAQPIRQIPRKVPFALRKEITSMVEEMLSLDVIQESSSG